ncbi:MAG: MFS transporter [Deltaproteobacteria bacterium]|nr:MFS transporter [Deltaproteobacteria bacterium]
MSSQPTSPPRNEKSNRNTKASLWTLLSVVVLDLIGFGVVIPILPFYAKSYGASATVLGVLLTSYAAMQFLFAPVWGRLSDRIGRRPVMLFTIAGTGVALLGLGLAPSLAWLFAARILGGAFGANISVATAYIADLAHPDERTKWMGMIGAAFGVGFVLGPAIGGILAPLGYHVPMLVAAGLALVNLIYAAVRLEEPPQRTEITERDTPDLALLKRSTVRRLCLAYFVFTFAVSQLETVFAFFMLDRFGYDAHQVAYVLVLMAIVMVLIQGGGIRPLAKRFGERRLLLAGGVLLCGSFAAVPWAQPVAILLIPLLVASVGRAIAHPAMLSLVSGAADESSRGAVMGTFQSSASLARVAGPVAAGALYDISGGAPFLLGSVLMAIVVGIGLGIEKRSAALPSS